MAGGTGNPAKDSQAARQTAGAVIVISSHVARGSVGNRSVVFALEALGHTVWSVPTILLPFHPGHGLSTKIVAPAEQFAQFLDDLANSPWIGEVGAVLTGYMANAAQADAVAGLVAMLKQQNPDLVYLCDPVIGDAGGIYVANETAGAIRDKLLPLADIATPNIYELAWLARRNQDGAAIDISDAVGAAVLAADLPCPAKVVTSAPAFMRGNIGSLYVADNEATLAEHKQLAGQPSGSGDLFAALFLARLLEGQPPAKALEVAAASTFEVIAHSMAKNSDELMPEACLASLQRPMAMVSTRRIATARS